MIRDDIMQALRLTAMGRFGHPLQEQLADKLVEVFAQLPKEHMDGCGAPDTLGVTATAAARERDFLGVWQGEWGEYPIPARFEDVKMNKQGLPDRRFKGNEPFWAWVAEQEAAAKAKAAD